MPEPEDDSEEFARCGHHPGGTDAEKFLRSPERVDRAGGLLHAGEDKVPLSQRRLWHRGFLPARYCARGGEIGCVSPKRSRASRSALEVRGETLEKSHGPEETK